MRVDMFSLKKDQTRGLERIDIEKMLDFVPLSVQWDNQLNIVLAPFCWDSCNVLLRGMSSDEDMQTIVSWFMDWFDPDDKKPSDESGLHGVVHFLSDPDISELSTAFEIDFGSAGTEAFTSLLGVISSLGVSEVSIGHSIGSR